MWGSAVRLTCSAWSWYFLLLCLRFTFHYVNDKLAAGFHYITSCRCKPDVIRRFFRRLLQITKTIFISTTVWLSTAEITMIRHTKTPFVNFMLSGNWIIMNKANLFCRQRCLFRFFLLFIHEFILIWGDFHWPTKRKGHSFTSGSCFTGWLKIPRRGWVKHAWAHHLFLFNPILELFILL